MLTDFKELLIIDDDCCHNIVSALAIKKLFRSSNVNFTCFTSSAEGLAHIMQSTASAKKTLLFLDVNMARLNGWKILEQLDQLPRAVKKHLDVYILTASPNERDRQRALRTSLVKQYLEKPLFQHLHSIFAKRSTLQLTAA
jgi:CheY-like chemotaxis protein